MAQIGSLVAAKLTDVLKQPETGVGAVLADLAVQQDIHWNPVHPVSIHAANVAPDLVERASAAKYPAIHVYCERLSNTLREKFRTFSGKARMSVEVRVSQDRVENIEERSQLLVDSVTTVLDASRGDWGQGMLYNGAYEVVYNPVKHGGKNFLQITKVTFDVDVSTN